MTLRENLFSVSSHLNRRNAKGILYEFAVFVAVPEVSPSHVRPKTQISRRVDFKHYLCVSLFSSLVSACGCSRPDCLFSNLLSSRSLIYLVCERRLFPVNCDCSKSSGRENSSIKLKHEAFSPRPFVSELQIFRQTLKLMGRDSISSTVTGPKSLGKVFSHSNASSNMLTTSMSMPGVGN